MLKSLLNAKKNKRAVLAVVAVFILMSAINAESVGVTIDFFGMAEYARSGGLLFENGYVPVLPQQPATSYIGTTTTGGDDLTATVNAGAPYYGVMAVAYDLDHNVTEWDKEYDWSVSVKAEAVGSYTITPQSDSNIAEPDETVIIDEQIAKVFNIDDESLLDILDEKKGLIDEITGIPLSNQIPDDEIVDGDSQQGVVYIPITDPDFLNGIIPDGEIQDGEVQFGGQIVLTSLPLAELSSDIDSTVAPEPASMILFGSGLVGLFGARRKFRV